MRILALDTAAAACSVAIWQDGVVRLDEQLQLGLTHSETLQAACDRALQTLGLAYADIDYFAATTGPGSFTGIRIGLTAAKTFAFATGKKLIGLNSLEVLAAAYHVSADMAVVALLDARRRRVFAAAYQNQKEELPPFLGEVDDFFTQYLRRDDLPKQILLCGDVAEKYYQDDVLNGLLAVRGRHFSVRGERQIRAAVLAELAAVRLAADPSCAKEAAVVNPLYLTATQAERGAGIYV